MIRYIIPVILTLSVSMSVYNASPSAPKLQQEPSIVFENKDLKVNKIGTYDNLSILFIKDKIAYAVEDHFIYKSIDNGRSFTQLGRLPKYKPNLLESLKDKISRLRIVRDLRRNRGPSKLTVLDSGTIIIIYDHIYRSTDGGQSFEIIPYPVSDFSPPYFNELAVSPSGNIYLGEYITTARPHVVRILQGSNDGKNWKVQHTFESGEIFHIHSIYWSNLLDSLIIATGDRPEEIKLLKTDDEFKTLEVIGEGDQGWRVVSIAETEDLLFWGADNDQTGAHIYSLNKGKRVQHNFIGKVSYDATTISPSTFLISETLEPLSPYTNSSNEDFSISTWISPNGVNWTEAIKFSLNNKVKLLQTGERPRLAFPNSDGSITTLFIIPRFTDSNQSCREPCTIAYEVEWK